MNSIKRTMVKPELLAPAGNMECFKAAIDFGADAVYMAGKKFGLRAYAANFSMDEIKEAVNIAHSKGRRVFITVNSLFRDADFEELTEYLRELKEIGVDAVIVSDPGVIPILREIGLEIHISTQSSTMNLNSARFWYDAGVKRVILARELSFDEIENIAKNKPEELEIEAFIHGAMCIAHSGRCLLSSYFTGRSANKGECAQPCRWEYTIREKGYLDDELIIEEDSRGTYILNSKDLMMIDYIPRLVKSGLRSLKIEGRMKSVYYVASVVNAYRKAIDKYFENPEGYILEEKIKNDLYDSSTRKFGTGFYFGDPKETGQDLDNEMHARKYFFCGIVRKGKDENGYYTVEQRGKFSIGEEIMILSPNMDDASFILKDLTDEDGNLQESANHAQQIVKLKAPFELQTGDIIRKLI